MPDELLFGVFATHLPFFVWRYRSTREPRHAATSVTFALLAAAYGLRIFAPEFEVAGTPLHGSIRTLALLSASVSVSMLAYHVVAIRRAS